MGMAPLAVISRHVTSKIAPPAALTTERPLVRHVRRLKPVARHLTNPLAQRVANHLVAVLMLKNVRQSHVLCAEFSC
jgi:hypothetical protein